MSEQPQRHIWHKSSWHTEAALLASVVLALFAASAIFVYMALAHATLYKLNGMMSIGHMEPLPPEWLELAVCFGPRLPAGALLANVTSAAPHNVDDAFSYWELFGGGGGFDWRRPPFELLAAPSAVVARRLGALQVTTSELLQPELRYTDMPMMFHYSLCRNFSGFRWSPTRNGGEHWLELTFSTEAHNRLLDGVAASFVEVFAYQRGRFNEFSSVSQLQGYRTDMGRPLRLRLEAVVHRDEDQNDGPCASRGDPTSCLFWCLMRALLRHADCTMPWMDALVFNMTAVRLLQNGVPTRRDPKLFSAKTALPWMAEFASVPPCASAAQFRALFRLVDSLLLQETLTPDAEVQRCRDTCPRLCDFMVTSLEMAGGTLSGWNGKSILRLELPHSLLVNHRSRLFDAQCLLLQLAGLLVFLFGVTVFGVYDWCLVAACRLLERAGLLAAKSSADEPPAEKGGGTGAGDGGGDEDGGYDAHG